MPTRAVLKVVNVALLAVLVGGALWAWPGLPERIPLHFGIDGTPDRWGGRSAAAWFAVPAIAVGMWALLQGSTAWLSRRPEWVNLPGGRRLSDLPPSARPRVLEATGRMMELVATETLVILGLVQLAMWRAAHGLPSQGLVLLVLAVALLSTPVLLAVWLIPLQRTLDEVGRDPGGS